jgi:hypothetical protein
MWHNAERETRALGAAALATTLAVASVGAQEAGELRPLRFETTRFEIIVVDQLAAASISDHSALARLVEGCKNVLPVSPEDSARLVGAPSLDITRAPVPPDSGLVSFFIVRRAGSRAECGNRDAQLLQAPTHGIVFNATTTLVDGDEISGATVMRGDAESEAAESSVEMVSRMTASGLLASPGGMARVTVPFGALSSPPLEPAAPLWLRVTLAGSDTALRIDLPRDILLELERRTIPARLSRAVNQPPDPGMAFVVPEAPTDRVLLEARRAYLSGDHRAASELALGRLDDRALSRADVRAARVQVALSALGHGDSASARFLFERAAAADPCLRLSDAASAESRAFFDAVRGIASSEWMYGGCARRPLPVVALRGAVMPGFGRPVGKTRRAAGPATAAILGVVLARAVLAEHESSQLYSDYLGAVQGDLEAEFGRRVANTYDRSEQQRRLAVTLYRAGAAIWVGSAVEAVLSEYRAHRRADVLGNYGAAPRAGMAARPTLAPLVAVDRVGFTLTFF